MVYLVVTPSISAALALVPRDRREELGLPQYDANKKHKESDECIEYLSHAQLITLSKYLQSERPTENNATCEDFSLHRLLRGTRVYNPPSPLKPKRDKTPEYLALMARLRAEQEAKEYQQMLQRDSKQATNQLFRNSAVTGGNVIHTEEDEDNIDPSLVVNILVSVIFTGFAVYWAITNFRVPGHLLLFLSNRPTEANYPGARSTQPARVFISLFAAIVVGIAEVVVYASYLRKINAAKLKEKNLVEKKHVMHAVVISSSAKAKRVDDTEGEKTEEIWGRGSHGGIRRRIRERWQRENESLNET
ncbi:hypothetical protein KEM54_001925 [Ascosphaera aggregata]|nr:hypothetical protein KEM54_001925 [Ascosphaera aggregata]